MTNVTSGLLALETRHWRQLQQFLGHWLYLEWSMAWVSLHQPIDHARTVWRCCIFVDVTNWNLIIWGAAVYIGVHCIRCSLLPEWRTLLNPSTSVVLFRCGCSGRSSSTAHRYLPCSSISTSSRTFSLRDLELRLWLFFAFSGMRSSYAVYIHFLCSSV